jgi:hypothetical protein
MNVGPINTSIPVATTDGGGTVGEAQASGDTNGGNANIPKPIGGGEREDPKIPGGAPEPLKQMSTSDFLGLRETTRTESVMDKLAKIFETILALRLLEKTVESVSKSLEDDPSKGEK